MYELIGFLICHDLCFSLMEACSLSFARVISFQKEHKLHA
jgi:hypothetical protein